MLLRWLDLLLLLAALPVFVFADLPFEAYVVGGGAWIVQRIVQNVVGRRASASDEPRTIAGLAVASMLVRAWTVALAIFLVGLANKDAGLAAAVLVIALFTVYFTTQLVTRPFGGPR